MLEKMDKNSMSFFIKLNPTVRENSGKRHLQKFYSGYKNTECNTRKSNEEQVLYPDC